MRCDKGFQTSSRFGARGPSRRSSDGRVVDGEGRPARGPRLVTSVGRSIAWSVRAGSRIAPLAAPCGRRQSDALPSPRSLHSRGRRSSVEVSLRSTSRSPFASRRSLPRGSLPFTARLYRGLPPVGLAGRASLLLAVVRKSKIFVITEDRISSERRASGALRPAVFSRGVAARGAGAAGNQFRGRSKGASRLS